jgi:hypothetical protein
MRISMRVLNDVGVKSVMQSIFSIGDFRPVRSLTRFPATDTHLPLLRLPLASSVFREGCVYSDPMEGTPEGLTDKVFWRKARGQWHGFKRLDQARKYICAAACAMNWKLRGGDGAVQVRRRHVGPEASVDEMTPRLEPEACTRFLSL